MQKKNAKSSTVKTVIKDAENPVTRIINILKEIPEDEQNLVVKLVVRKIAHERNDKYRLLSDEKDIAGKNMQGLIDFNPWLEKELVEANQNAAKG